MTTKATILTTIGIIIGMILVGGVLLFVFINPTARNANDRAAMLGQGVALAGMVPIFVIWMLWAARFRKEREEREKLQSKLGKQ